ncbi:replication-associated recombination protein A [Deinococcus maricopensis]|uniref:AAA ATPase central domain protein n=1 Tax=Deinococcus maricopensis (strain DSM 21211 / LMG 22137 / NRRL B-23946 / LB-34) TaxID=709986 RepID=E8U6J5_DEIML|nr:replication-associated recombination protein A [Deinococcus maricopensis]ADV66684.1 AAA ATPase central domain protein [Deinococcus maricopensis DSM 21211]
MTLFEPPAPLAERLRPRTIEEVVGQRHLLGPGRPLTRTLASGRLGSLILWGPPGVGKTTLARLLARAVDAHFIALSAVSAGVKDIREAVGEAERERGRGRRTLLFLDEIHRFNKAQQDALLPHVESGLLTLIGATTENPSFEVNPALRSRARTLVLEALTPEDIRGLLERALADERGLPGVTAQPEALDLLARLADGDARRALSTLEVASTLADPVTPEAITEAFGRHLPAMDKNGEDFYNLISALHKSVRGSHVDASLYWLARMVEGGADTGYVARRVVRMASEDIGLADPQALRLAIAARDAVEFLGSPEGDLALAQAVVYLALAPKSNSVYTAWGNVLRAVREGETLPVPVHLRNAPTALMRQQGYGKGYAYYFDDPEGSFEQAYLPDGVHLHLYAPTGEGWEARVRERWRKLQAAHGEALPDEPAAPSDADTPS